MPTTKPLRLILADELALVRAGLQAYLSAYPRLQVIGEAENGEEALQLCELLQPDLVLMAARQPGLDGIGATRLIRQRWPRVQVLLLNPAPDDGLRQAAQKAGASGCLSQNLTASELAQAIRQATEGKADLDDRHTIPDKKLPEPIAPAVITNHPDPQLEQAGQRAVYELEMAGRIQSSILPEQPPELHGWDLAAILEPAHETSGDFYDFIPLPYGKWGLVIGDVADKGLGASLFMALCSSLMRTYATRYPSLPGLTMNAVNERLLADTRRGMLVTAFFAVLEPETSRLRYVNAGHNPPLLLSDQKGKPVDRLPKTGTALGILEEAVWQQKLVKFNPGDLLLLYTDGITEAQNPWGDFFGEERLLEVLRRVKGKPAQEIQHAVLQEVNRFIGSASRQDDIALIVLSRKGSGKTQGGRMRHEMSKMSNRRQAKQRWIYSPR